MLLSCCCTAPLPPVWAQARTNLTANVLSRYPQGQHRLMVLACLPYSSSMRWTAYMSEKLLRHNTLSAEENTGL